jgi:CHAD domain-containing protein
MLRRLGAPEPHDSSLPLVDLDRSVRADTGIRRIHLGLLRLVAENEAGVRAGIDTEFLHDFRVTVRRTRALLGQIRHVLPSDAVEHFSAEFSWLGRLAGPPRDLDVLVLRLRQNRGEVPADDMDMLLAHFGVMQRREHVTLVRALESPRYRRLLTQWKSFLEQPSSSGSESRNAARPLVEVVSKRAWRLYGRIAKGGAGIDGETPAGRVHELRIDAKKLRYLIDVTPSFYAVDDLESIVGTLKKLQRVLGDFNDAHVQETVLLECGRAMAEAGAPAGALMTVGRLAEQRRQSGCRLRAEIADRLARFRAGKARSACRRAFKTAHTEERR